MFNNNGFLDSMIDADTYYDSEIAVHLIYRPHFPKRPMFSEPVVSRIWKNEGLVVKAKICDLDPDLGCWMRSIFSVNLGPAVRRIDDQSAKHRYVEEIFQVLSNSVALIAELHEWPLMSKPHFIRTTLKNGGHKLKLTVVFSWAAAHVHPGNVFGHIKQLTQLMRDKVVAVEAPVNLTHYTELEDRPSLTDV